MTRQRTPGRHRSPSRTLPLTQPRRAAAVALVAATGLASSHGPLSDAAPSQPSVKPSGARTSGVYDQTTADALAMLQEIQPVLARQARQTRRLGSDLTVQAETATASASTRRERAAAATLAKRARQTRALGRDLTAQAEATEHGVALMQRFVAGGRATGTVAQLADQVADADAAEAFLVPLAVTARTETTAELTAARNAVNRARTSAARAKAQQRVRRAKQDLELVRLIVRAADIVRLEAKRTRAAHANAVTSQSVTKRPATAGGVPVSPSTPAPTTSAPTTPSAGPGPHRFPVGGASPVAVPTRLL